MAKFLAISGIFVGSTGIFFGFYFLTSNDIALAVKIVTLSTVGVVGVLAFVRHVIFHKSDAERLGWETDRPDWIYEVGFANLAFAVIAILSVFPDTGIVPQALIILGYALYLMQAGILHGYRYFTDEKKSFARLFRSSIATLLYAIMMSYFSFYVLF